MVVAPVELLGVLEVVEVPAPLEVLVPALVGVLGVVGVVATGAVGDVGGGSIAFGVCRRMPWGHTMLTTTTTSAIAPIEKREHHHAIALHARIAPQDHEGGDERGEQSEAEEP